MKIKILITLIFALFSTQAFATKSIDPDLNVELIVKKKDDRDGLEKFDFKKLFENAERYYKEAKAWKKIKCEPKSGFICTKHACKARPSQYYLILDKEEETVTRCDKDDNCESFEAEFEQTGVFFNIQAKGPVGTLIRVLGDYRYKEIATVGLDAYIANGECLVVPE